MGVIKSEMEDMSTGLWKTEILSENMDELAEPHDWKMKKGKWTVEERIRRRKERRRRKNTEKRNKRILTKLQENNNIWDSDELSFDNNENIRGNRVKEEA